MNLPDSKIISELSEKANNRKDSRINIIPILDDLRHRISSEVKYVIQLFPEYTPHDEENHLSRLFFLGDKLLGDEILANLNCTELFILASSLYAHDWGMAVSEREKESLLNKDNCQSLEKEDFALIEEEYSIFQSFLVENNIKANDISLSDWQEYVRNTHATRSGERIRKYFESIDSGLGEAIARACEGHWLDFKDIQNPTNYPTNFAVCSETVNLRAIAVYVRLIDLLDMTQERTPYVLWKYVAPKNLRSKMEWKKHRAIHSISFPPYQDGRVVQVDGGTNSHEVYAALQDLKNLCNEQFKGCNDILTQINDSRYNLNLFHIDWRIQARTFNPISIQFEFDRIRMFEILSDEIYQGDKYVFLRELLQNSIDAINVRKAILEKRGIQPNSIGIIEIDIQNTENGNCQIVVTDDGIGMDEYIVRNYLSVAGKSYYNSDDFKKLGLSLDPISKFGVGVLSCFMVADELGIETFMDPYMNNRKSEVLRISIPAVEKQFRIQTYSTRDSKVGTTFKVHVLKSKLNAGLQQIQKLKVTEYLLRIAGFVKIPIKINEDGVKTLIIHPNEDPSKYQTSFATYSIRKLDLNYPWEKAFLPQSIKNAKEILKETRIDFTKDLNLGEMAEGIVSFVEPIDPNLFMMNYDLTWPGNDFIFKDRSGTVNKRVQFNRDWTRYERYDNHNNLKEHQFGKSAKTVDQFKVYLDGILLPNAKAPERLFGGNYYSDNIENEDFRIQGLEDRFILPLVIINFKKSALKGIDLSRTEITDNKNSHWEKSVKEKFNEYFKSNHLKKLEGLVADQRLSIISNLILYNRLGVNEIVSSLSIEKWPVPVIEPDGTLRIRNWSDFIGENVFLEPYRFGHFSKLLIEKYENLATNKDPLDKWVGGEFIPTSLKDDGLKRNTSSQLHLMIKLYNSIIKRTHIFSSFRFLKSPWKNGPPLIQSVWTPIQEADKITEMSKDELTKFEAIIKDFASLTYDSFRHFLRKIELDESSDGREFYMPAIGPFQKPFDSKLAYGFRILNFNNPLVKNILSLISLIYIEKKKAVINTAALNDLKDKIRDLAFFDYSAEYEGCDINKENVLIDSIFSTAAKELRFLEIGSYRMTNNSFVDFSLVQKESQLISYFTKRDLDKVELDLADYSRPLY